MTPQELVREITKKTQNNQSVITVFDLDSTLFDVSPRIQEILRRFCEDSLMLTKYPEQISWIKKARVKPNDWGYSPAILRTEAPPASDEIKKALLDHWNQLFFSNELLKHDLPSTGAIDFVQAVHKAGATVMYLTGRDQHRMGTGTIDQINQWGLPLVSEKHLQVKPHKDLLDADYKSAWMTELIHNHPAAQIILFDNEPVILNRIQKDCPSVQIVFFESTHSQKESPQPDWIRWVDFL